MGMLTIKVRSEKRGDHIYDTVFIGPKGQTLQNAGQVIFSSEAEWGLFGAVLLLGADVVKQKRTAQGVDSDVEVVFEGWNGKTQNCRTCSESHGRCFGDVAVKTRVSSEGCLGWKPIEGVDK
jgi:hypothetical protein